MGWKTSPSRKQRPTPPRAIRSQGRGPSVHERTVEHRYRRFHRVWHGGRESGGLAGWKMCGDGWLGRVLRGVWRRSGWLGRVFQNVWGASDWLGRVLRGGWLGRVLRGGWLGRVLRGVWVFSHQKRLCCRKEGGSTKECCGGQKRKPQGREPWFLRRWLRDRLLYRWEGGQMKRG